MRRQPVDWYGRQDLIKRGHLLSWRAFQPGRAQNLLLNTAGVDTFFSAESIVRSFPGTRGLNSDGIKGREKFGSDVNSIDQISLGHFPLMLLHSRCV